MLTFVTFLAALASLVTIASGTALAIRSFRQSKERNRWLIGGTIGIILLVLIVGFIITYPGGILSVTKGSIGFGQSPNRSTPLPPTPTPHMIIKNLPIVCSPVAIDPPCLRVGVILNSITLDTTQQFMQWDFTLTNDDTVTSSASLDLTLQDPNGNTFAATGPATEGIEMAPGQSLQRNAFFDFLPIPKLQYQLISMTGFLGVGRDNKVIVFTF